MIPAKLLNSVSGGRITPNHVTLVSLLGHGLFLWAIWQNRPLEAALFLAFFGIMDSLDGALARLQHTASVTGMLYDATSDRVKETIVYVGLTHYVLVLSNPRFIWLPAAVLGGSLVVSYIKAKGEMAMSAGGKHSAQELNRIFSDGLARYEVRMSLVIIGLLTGRVVLALWILLLLVVFTALQRLIRVSKALTHV